MYKLSERDFTFLKELELSLKKQGIDVTRSTTRDNVTLSCYIKGSLINRNPIKFTLWMDDNKSDLYRVIIRLDDKNDLYTLCINGNPTTITVKGAYNDCFWFSYQRYNNLMRSLLEVINFLVDKSVYLYNGFYQLYSSKDNSILGYRICRLVHGSIERHNKGISRLTYGFDAFYYDIPVDIISKVPSDIINPLPMSLHYDKWFVDNDKTPQQFITEIKSLKEFKKIFGNNFIR